MLASLLLASLTLSALPSSHGGAFPAPPPAPAPPPPPVPLGAPPPGGIGSPVGAVPAPGTIPVLSQGYGQNGSPDELDWTRWWNFERERYLGLNALELDGPLSGGKSTRATRKSLMPSRERIESEILPRLLEVLEAERDDSMISAALIAVARIGSGERRDLSVRIGVAIKEKLRAKSQEIAETAALSLGILGEDAALQPLLDLLSSNEEGGRLVGGKVVPTRTRAFAALGLGLMAHQREESQVRQRIAAALMEAIAADHRSDEIPVAAALAMGLCPVPNRLSVPDKSTRASAFAHEVTAREAQIRWLIERLGPDRRVKNPLPRIARVHGASALGRLCVDALPHVREDAIQTLLDLATSRESPIHLQTGAWIGLGGVLNAGGHEVDRAGLKDLLNALKKGHVLEQHFAGIAVAMVTSRPGPAIDAATDPTIDDGSVDAVGTGLEDRRWLGLESGRRALLQQLARARPDSSPWFALAIGIQNWHLQREGMPYHPIAALTLRDRVRTERSAAFLGAYGIACALAHEGGDEESCERAGNQIHRAFKRTKDPVARGQLAIALGLLDHEPARKDLNELMGTSRFQPELLWSASVALVLIQDQTLVPTLIDTLKKARSASGRGAAAAALGRVGDGRAAAPLLELLDDESQPDAARAFAVVGLGLLCEEASLPWRTPIAHANPYFAVTETLSGNGRGLLDLN